MRVLLLCIATCLALAGCVTHDPLRSGQPASVTAAPADPAPVSTANTGWQMVMPVTGGVPIVALPLGGTIYLPATGDPPVIGTPLFP